MSNTTIKKASGTCYTERLDSDTTTDNRLATLRARVALAGVTLQAIENDHGETVHIVSRLAMTRELQHLDVVDAWVDRVMGGRHV